MLLAISFSLRAQNTLFFGMTQLGGSNQSGAIISFNPANNTENVVWNFGNGTDGRFPNGNLSFNPANGLFYGLTYFGGSDSAGVIFSFDPRTNSENVVWNFGYGADGAHPNATLVIDPVNGLFYGTTAQGGLSDSGTVFSFNPLTDSENVVWNFAGGNDGRFPDGNLVYNLQNSLFYGMTSGGGTYDSGTIFSFNPGANSDNIVWNLGNGSDGAVPFGSLVFDEDSNLYYGMTSLGGTFNAGSIISFNPTSNREKMLWSFGNNMDGNTPLGDLVYNSGNHLFYGMTQGGGNVNEGEGVIISFNPATSRDSVLWSFGNGTDGQNPLGNLVYDGSALYYGMTSQGGTNGVGTIISFDPETRAESVVWSFDSAGNGNSPNGSLVMYSGPTGIEPALANYVVIGLYPNPAAGFFTISGLISGDYAALYNCLGQQIIYTPVQKATVQMDISTYMNGIYLLRIFNQDGMIIAEKKLVKISD